MGESARVVFGERMVVVRGGGPARGQSGFAKATPRQDFQLSTLNGALGE